VQNHGSYGKLRYGVLVLTEYAAFFDFGRQELIENFDAKLKDLTVAYRLWNSASCCQPESDLSSRIRCPLPIPTAAPLAVGWVAWWVPQCRSVAFTAIVVADLEVPLGVVVDFDLSSPCAPSFTDLTQPESGHRSPDLDMEAELDSQGPDFAQVNSPPRIDRSPPAVLLADLACASSVPPPKTPTPPTDHRRRATTAEGTPPPLSANARLAALMQKARAQHHVTSDPTQIKTRPAGSRPVEFQLARDTDKENRPPTQGTRRPRDPTPAPSTRTEQQPEETPPKRKADEQSQTNKDTPPQKKPAKPKGKPRAKAKKADETPKAKKADETPKAREAEETPATDAPQPAKSQPENGDVKCGKCGSGDAEHPKYGEMLLCSARIGGAYCTAGLHVTCASLKKVPKDKWYCAEHATTGAGCPLGCECHLHRATGKRTRRAVLV
jgi:hypothetical protein